jgi:hypothetical protein
MIIRSERVRNAVATFDDFLISRAPRSRVKMAGDRPLQESRRVVLWVGVQLVRGKTSHASASSTWLSLQCPSFRRPVLRYITPHRTAYDVSAKYFYWIRKRVSSISYVQVIKASFCPSWSPSFLWSIERRLVSLQV